MTRFRTGVLGFALGLCAMAFGQGFGPTDSIRWSTYKDGTQSRFTEPFTRVINNEAEFQTYWSRAFGAPPHTAPRDIDWMKSQLIAIHLGERRTGGYKVVVDSIKRTRAATITVSYAELTPPKGRASTQALTQPWVIVRMDRAAGIIEYTKTTREDRPTIISRNKGCGCCARCTWPEGPPVEILPAHREINTSGRPYDSRVWWRSFQYGEHSSIQTQGYRVIRSLEELNRYWAAHTGSSRNYWDEDPVDWRREQIVAVNLGFMPGAGYTMGIDSLERTGVNTITIRYTVVYPRLPQGGRLSAPFALIRTDRSDDRYVLVRRNYLPTIDDPYCDCRCGRCRGHR